MPKLKTKHQFALILIVNLYAFLLLFSLIFFFSFSIILQNQIKKELQHEVADLLDNFLVLKDKEIQFIKNQRGESLRQYLFSEGVSAIFFDKDRNVIRKYGVFELNEDEEKKRYQDFYVILKKAKQKKQIQEISFTWHGENLLAFISPLDFQSSTLGMMVVAKTLNNINNLKTAASAILLSLAFLGLLGSVSIGYFFTKKAFYPIKKITESIEKINLDFLDKTVQIEGHPEDETVILSNKFNLMLERLKQMSDKQKEFVSNASHELQTPLASAISSLDIILLQKKLDKNEIELVKQDLLNVSKLIQKLLLFSKITNDNFFIKEKASVRETIKDLRRKFSTELQKKRLVLDADLKSEDILDIPQEFLNIIMSNLLSNAIKFSKNMGRIIIQDNLTGMPHTVLIQDFGEGMTSEEKSKIFSRFVGQDNGVGLTLVKQICDFFQINIEIESKKKSVQKFC